MIIFDLDGTLADCEHRRHFVDPEKNLEYSYMKGDMMTRLSDGYFKPREGTSGYIKFKSDFKSFYEACDKDEPIWTTIEIINLILNRQDEDVQIWSGRCESEKEKTVRWLRNHLDVDQWFYRDCLKMRPIGDSTPDEVLKERWLDEALNQGKTIEYVFDDRPKVVQMWRRRGIFVFNCCQHDREF